MKDLEGKLQEQLARIDKILEETEDVGKRLSLIRESNRILSILFQIRKFQGKNLRNTEDLEKVGVYWGDGELIGTIELEKEEAELIERKYGFNSNRKVSSDLGG